LKVIFSNLIGFDGLIFLVAAAEIFIFIKAKAAAETLYKAMHKHVYAPSYQDDINSIQEGVEGLTDLKLSALREKAVSAYTIYMNLTGIFPLLGILGTVISLIGMVGNTTDIEGNFFAALTSTFWGLIFAIVFKFLDAFISPKLDDGERAAELFMQRRPSFSSGKRESGRRDSDERRNDRSERTDRYEKNDRGTRNDESPRRSERRPMKQGASGSKSDGPMGTSAKDGQDEVDGLDFVKRRNRDSWRRHPEMQEAMNVGEPEYEPTAQIPSSSQPKAAANPRFDEPASQTVTQAAPVHDDVPLFIDDSIDDGEVHE